VSDGDAHQAYRELKLAKAKQSPRLEKSENILQIMRLGEMMETNRYTTLAGVGNQIDTLNHQLKFCPFCWAQETGKKRSVLDTVQIAQGRFAVVCSCGARGPAETSQEKARNAWNNRYHGIRSSWSDAYRLLRNETPGEFRGDLNSVSCSAILQLLSSEGKSGILHIASGQKRSGICLKNGRIVAATCSEGPHLGQILQDKGFISRAILQQSLIAARRTGKLLGETLLCSKHVSHKALVEAIRFQVREVVMDVMLWQEGEFRYSDCITQFDLQGFEGIKATVLLLEAAVVIDEARAA